jgi:multicomponent Na+:H+ antiporter subunit B
MIGTQSFIFSAVVRLLFFLINLVALHLFLRGHDLPGGGFIAGLATSISLILLSLALGMETLHKVVRVDPARLAIVGLAVALGSSVIPALMGRPFLEHFHGDWKGILFLGDVAVGTTILFDLGVYFVVVGSTTKIIFVLAKSTQGLRALVEEEEARYSSPMEQPIEDQGTAGLVDRMEADRLLDRGDDWKDPELSFEQGNKGD